MQIDDLTQEPVRQFFRNDYSPYCTIICTWRGLTRPQTPAERVVEAAMRLWRMEVQFKGVKISTEQIMQFRAAIEEFDQARSALEARSAS